MDCPKMSVGLTKEFLSEPLVSLTGIKGYNNVNL